jgi:radical SAM protein with 4Fe4S-binding SPASM domain
MDVELFKKIVSEIKDYVLESYIMLGGEPLLHKQLLEMIEYMTKNEVGSIMHTNGTFLTEEKSYGLITSGLSLISFSIDGYDKKTYEEIRVNAHYEETLGNILKFLKIKKALKARHPYVRIQCITNTRPDDRFSRARQQRFAALFDGLPVDEFDTQVVSNLAREYPTKVYTIERPKNVTAYEQLGFTYHPCQRLWSTLTILWDGTVVPCCVDFHGALPVGNATEKSLLKIWNDQPMQQLRTRHIQKDIDDLPLCATCNIPFSHTIMTLPINFPGHQSILRRYLGPLFGPLSRRLRFRGLGLSE